MKNQKMKNIDLVEIKDVMLDLFEIENINIYHAEKILECTFNWDGETPDPESVKIKVVSQNESKDSIGIHLFPEDWNDLEYLLMSRVETALRDGFETIYIHAA